MTRDTGLKALLVLTLLGFTFPDTFPFYKIAVDPQIHWIFNHLAYEGFQEGQHIIFPHGPLSFLLFPLA